MEELKGVVTQALEKKGILAKIRAELRASVFEAIDEQGAATNTGLGSQRTERFEKLQSSEDGLMAAHLVYEFLEWCGLDYTLKVYKPEAGGSALFPKRSELGANLGLDADPAKPLLVAMLERCKMDPTAHHEASTPDSSSGRKGVVNRLLSDTNAGSPSSDDSPSPDIFSRARRSADRSSTDPSSGKPPKTKTPRSSTEPEIRERRRSPRNSQRTSPRNSPRNSDYEPDLMAPPRRSPLSSPNTSAEFDSLGMGKAGALGDLPTLGGRARPQLAPLGGGAQLPPLRGSGLSHNDPLSSSPTGTSHSNRLGPKSPSERSDHSGVGLNQSGGLDRSLELNQSGGLDRSLELGRSADFSDHYSADFDDRDIEEELDVEVVDEVVEEVESEDSYVFTDEHNHSMASDGTGGRRGMSMDMMASGLSASDRSGDLDLLDDEADHIESAEMD